MKLTKGEIEDGDKILVRIAAMLTKLCRYSSDNVWGQGSRRRRRQRQSQGQGQGQGQSQGQGQGQGQSQGQGQGQGQSQGQGQGQSQGQSPDQRFLLRSHERAAFQHSNVTRELTTPKYINFRLIRDSSRCVLIARNPK
jgi:hypothetical protein